jgi:hypothetical protein
MELNFHLVSEAQDVNYLTKMMECSALIPC